VVVGIGLLALNPILGGVIAGIGAVWFVLTLAPVQERIPYTVVRKQTLVERRLSDKTLGLQCLDLSKDLHEELADFKLNNPRTLNWGLGYPSPTTSEGKEQEREENKHRARFEARFQKYRGRAAWLLHEIETRDLAATHKIWHASHAGMSGETGVDELAGLLAIVGHQLTEEDDSV
jgi:hypothetical protein